MADVELDDVIPPFTGTVLESMIRQSLEMYLLDNALFLANRLIALSNSSPRAILLLADCYMRKEQFNRAHCVLQSHLSASQDHRYMFATACLRLGKEAEALEVLRSDEQDSNSAPLLYLMGVLYKRVQQKSNAIAALKRCLQLSPFMWAAFAELCQLGESVDARAFFDASLDNDFLVSSVQQKPFPLSSAGSTISEEEPQTPAFPQVFAPETPSMFDPSQTPISFASPAFRGISAATPIILNTGRRIPDEPASTEAVRRAPFSTTSRSTRPAPATTVSIATTPMIPPEGQRPHTGQRKAPAPKKVLPRRKAAERGARLKFESASRPQAETRRGRAKSNPHITEKETDTTEEPSMEIESPSPSLTPEDIQSALKYLMELLCSIANGYRRLCRFELEDALDCFNTLPDSQVNSGDILSLIGRAYYEVGAYREAEDTFQKVRRYFPHQIEGMEIYSTVLWHLRKDVDLAYLAQSLQHFERRAPEAWCAVGNCFSLQKDHETAVKFFRRALQLNPSFAYAHTLQGHEFVSNDELDKASRCFRDALRIDDRLYNAWYGLGMVYFRQEKLELANYHYRRALEINPHNSVLRCYIGIVSASKEASLEAYTKAIKSDPKNNMARFKRAATYADVNRLDDAMEDLTALKDAAPKEPQVWFLMGKIHQMQGNLDDAMQCFTMALDLDDKNANGIKNFIDKCVAEMAVSQESLGDE